MFNIKEIRILRQYGLARLCRIKYDNNKLEYTPRILYESEIKHLITVVPKFIATRFLSEEFNEYSLLNVKNGILFIKYTILFISKIGTGKTIGTVFTVIKKKRIQTIITIYTIKQITTFTTVHQFTAQLAFFNHVHIKTITTFCYAVRIRDFFTEHSSKYKITIF